MIPVHMRLSGFLSYRDPVDINFESFDLACISGSNGAGKSSLLDAITWVLFGQARKRDDSIIHAGENTAEVVFDFLYEGNLYRVQRSKTRDKSAMLEFYIQNPADGDGPRRWKALTEKGLRETEARIVQTLRMDYDTFTNASFFLQGKADQFAQQRPGDRKRILSNILGLEIWETYRERAVARRRGVEGDVSALDGGLAEINAELDEEEARRSRLAELENSLKQLAEARSTQGTALENLRRVAAALADQRKLVNTLQRQLRSAEDACTQTEKRLESRRTEEAKYQDELARAEEIEAAYQNWQDARQELENWDASARTFNEQEKRRSAPLMEIEKARGALQSELKALESRAAGVEQLLAERAGLEQKRAAVESQVAELKSRVELRAEVEQRLGDLRQQVANANAENPRLNTEMKTLKSRIIQLEDAVGVDCPVCGQPLPPEQRQALIESLTTEGTAMGDRYRQNQALLREAETRLSAADKELAALQQAENELHVHLRQVDQLNARLAQITADQQDWDTVGKPRLEDVRGILAGETFAPEARARLAAVDAELKTIGYDAAAHDAVRRREQEGRSSEAELRRLETARAALAPLQREITELQTQWERQSEEYRGQRTVFDEAAASLAAAAAQAPDVNAAEREWLQIQEQENRKRMEVGAARQKVAVLDDLRERHRDFSARRAELTKQISQLKSLERAFSKDGVPALLIEQALPDIEEHANNILEQLSGATMSVRFVTQKDYKDKNRDDKKETLDIVINDGSGARDYEMFSGGEAFRVNFAIRLALSRVLAQRAGARLQTLVIDEGFGSQDALGRQRLVEAINLVKPDFAKILVITHLEELKDAFPNRIEVEKTLRGSTIRVV
jgi:exonuclease SbcC